VSLQEKTLTAQGDGAMIVMKVRDLVRLLEADGWRLVRTRGSHRQFKHSTKRGLVTVAGSNHDELARKTLQSVFKQAGLKP
jgi:predicted RNA binding protein YcfA (HicA-like mRNA interferase family)